MMSSNQQSQVTESNSLGLKQQVAVMKTNFNRLAGAKILNENQHIPYYTENGEFTIEYTFNGRYVPATRFQQEEYPELEITALTDEFGNEIDPATIGKSWDEIKDYVRDNGEPEENDSYDYESYEDDRFEDDLNENESILADQGYTHFAINKTSGKIVEAWNYSDYEQSELMTHKKDYFTNDVMELGLGLKPSDLKVVTKVTLMKMGLNPEDINSWDDLKTKSTQVSPEALETPASPQSLSEQLKKMSDYANRIGVKTFLKEGMEISDDGTIKGVGVGTYLVYKKLGAIVRVISADESGENFEGKILTDGGSGRVDVGQNVSIKAKQIGTDYDFVNQDDETLKKWDVYNDLEPMDSVQKRSFGDYANKHQYNESSKDSLAEQLKEMNKVAKKLGLNNFLNESK